MDREIFSEGDLVTIENKIVNENGDRLFSLQTTSSVVNGSELASPAFISSGVGGGSIPRHQSEARKV